jgi:hypothetical protein
MSDEWIAGNTYNVPCVEATVHGRRGTFVVFGPWHEDSEHLSFDAHHYHLDLRFAPDWVFSYGTPPAALAITEVCSQVNFRRRKMRRAMPIFPFVRYRTGRLCGNGPTFERLAAAFSKSRLGSHLQCPHKGASLAHLPAVCGVLVCPLHGLCFDERTGNAIDPVEADRRMSKRGGVGP